MKRLLVLLVILALCRATIAQVLNDNIEHRIPLQINASPYTSTTANCTVDRACISEALEGNCVKFHNDQWFWFKTGAAGTYYLNVSGQDCRDILGVQLMVIDGIPCQPETYQLVSCASLASQDDIYLQLDSLKANYSYLINVDGYLHDFCDFSIQLGTTPKGLPAKPATAIIAALTATQHSETITLDWLIDNETANDLATFEILRRHASEKRFTPIKGLPVTRDTYGNPALAYSYIDSLTQAGTYHFKIIATQHNLSRLQVAEHIVHYTPLKPKKQSAQSITVHLNYKAGTQLSIYILHPESKKVLRKSEITVDKKHPSFQLNTSPYLEAGIRSIEVKITDHKKKHTTSSIYSF